MRSLESRTQTYVPLCSLHTRFLTLPKSTLPKFVQINWCGEGVPEARKGLFHTHSSAVANFLRGTHVVVSARNEVREHSI